MSQGRPHAGPPFRPGPIERREWVERGADRLIPSRFRRYREQILYLAAGGWNTLFGYAVFAALYAFSQHVLPLPVILVITYVIAVTNNYLLYRIVVFRSHAPIWRELPRFSIVYVVTLAVNLAVLPLALHALPLNAYAIQAVFTIVVVVASYGANKYFSFAHVSSSEAGEESNTPN